MSSKNKGKECLAEQGLVNKREVMKGAVRGQPLGKGLMGDDKKFGT